MRCQSCEVLTINGIRCHETGCPDAWRDYARDCRECGCAFKPETAHQRTCDDCANPVPDYIAEGLGESSDFCQSDNT